METYIAYGAFVLIYVVLVAALGLLTDYVLSHKAYIMTLVLNFVGLLFASFVGGLLLTLTDVMFGVLITSSWAAVVVVTALLFALSYMIFRNMR